MAAQRKGMGLGTVRVPRAATGRHDDLPKGREAVLETVVGAVPTPRAPAVTPVATALPVDIERKLAELVGIDPIVSEPLDDPSVDPTYDELKATHFAKRVLQVAQQLTLGSLLLMVVCAVVAARTDSTSLPVHSTPLTIWAVAAAMSAVGLAALVTDPDVADGLSPLKRRALGSVLMSGLLVSLTGAVANADGLAAPTWVLFLPVVVVSGAVLGPSVGLLVGALSSSGIYAAAGFSHTLDIAGVGRLVVILPAMPLFGWAAGALASGAHQAVARARDQRIALIDDVHRLSTLLDSVSNGDLSAVPSLEDPADQATATLAVVFADTVLSLRRLVRQLSDVSEHLAENASDLAGTASSQVGAVEQQASAVSQTTSTIEQLAATATSIAETAERVSTFAGSTRVDVDTGVRSVAAATASMMAIGERVKELGARTGRLDERVAQIAEMTRLIDELGRRTTMLAVNASIEAARVGELGHGFSTVATEIGALAAKARAATAGIAEIVKELEVEVAATGAVSREGVEAVAIGLERQEVVETALVQISARVDDTTRAAHDITAATRQQRVASDAVVQAMHLVTGSSQSATSATRSHAASAERLRDLMSTLLSAVARFRLE
ncbi:MAG: methyl-accepting chemotaxis protein [Frankiaceae bacterium]|nr:methyl-accepting chemotaxis protein [Frankiaceae bacterium]MBV9872963.1 methyl-accepting chemotaxis protein [Frankiaceae bacterium]